MGDPTIQFMSDRWHFYWINTKATHGGSNNEDHMSIALSHHVNFVYHAFNKAYRKKQHHSIVKHVIVYVTQNIIVTSLDHTTWMTSQWYLVNIGSFSFKPLDVLVHMWLHEEQWNLGWTSLLVILYALRL